MGDNNGYEDALLAIETSPSYGAVATHSPLTPGRISKPQVLARTSPGTPATTHNDPSLRLQTEQLRGSTRMLQQYYQSTPQTHRRRWSSGDVMPLIEDNELFLESNDICGLPPLPKLGQAPELKIPNSGGIRASFRGFVSHVHKGFFQDARSLAEGTIPQSVVLSFAIGIVCGVAAFLYYTCLFFLLNFCWNTIPKEYIMNYWPEEYYWVYAPLVSFTFALLVGLSVVYLGEPGDLPFTISCIHNEGYIPMVSQ